MSKSAKDLTPSKLKMKMHRLNKSKEEWDDMNNEFWEEYWKLERKEFLKSVYELRTEYLKTIQVEIKKLETRLKNNNTERLRCELEFRKMQYNSISDWLQFSLESVKNHKKYGFIDSYTPHSGDDF